MPKIITAKRQEDELERARAYVKQHILFPAGLLGLVCLVAGTFALVYQFFFETYTKASFMQTSGLMLAGGLLGWAQTRYHRYVLHEHPWYFAARQKLFTKSGPRRGKKDPFGPPLEHPGRSFVPLGYVLGAGFLVGLGAWSAYSGQVDALAAFAMPWAAFFWAKMFFWRRVLLEGNRQK
ncbi:hypothetical protein [Nitrospira sp. Kam-Ns4a]